MLLIVAITVTTILVVVTGLQLIFVLRELRAAIKKNGHVVSFDKKEAKDEKAKEKKYQKKPSTLHSIIGKIRLLAPSSSHKNKRFFIKEN